MTHYTQTIPESIEADIVSTFFNYRYCRSLTYGKAFDLLAKAGYEVEVQTFDLSQDKYTVIVHHQIGEYLTEEVRATDSNGSSYYKSDWCEAANRGIELAIEMYNKNNQQCTTQTK